MTTFMRTVIEVPDDVVHHLDQVNERENCSRAALIREAIVEFLQQKAIYPAEAAFGLWKERDVDGVAYQAALLSEWENPGE